MLHVEPFARLVAAWAWCRAYPLLALWVGACLLGVVLIGLRLLGVIAWSWALVLLPLLVPAVLLAFALLSAWRDLTENGWH